LTLSTFLHRHQIHFDENRSNVLGGAAEDCDLGKQIEAAHGSAIYQSKAIVYHHDPTNWMWFTKRYIKSYAAYLNFQKKWPATPLSEKKSQVEQNNFYLSEKNINWEWYPFFLHTFY